MTKPILVTYAGVEYDVTKFVDMHPAGRTIIEKRNGKDITADFDRVKHTSGARALLRKYRVNKGTGQEPEPTADSKANDAYIAKVLARKLFTEEDKMNVHKTLGLLALFSFIYRYLVLLPTTGTLGFRDLTPFNLASLALHMALSASSLIFHVLEKRITKNPLVIYEEYRLHAIVFTARALGVSLIGMCMHLIPEQVRALTLGAFMVCIHLIVDLITAKYGTPGTTAVRNKDDGRFALLKKFFSYYQFAAIGSHLILDDNLCDLGWNAVGAVQSSAFLMTLKRKGLIRWTTYAWWYGLALVLSMAYMALVKGPAFFLLVAVAFYIRITFRTNKYVLWLGYALAIYFQADIVSNLDPWQASLKQLIRNSVAGLKM